MARPTPLTFDAEVDLHRLLSPHVVLLGLRAPGLVGRPFSPGDKVKLAAPGGPPKSYTPAYFDGETGRLDIAMHLHGNGPTARWAASARVGETVALVGPVRSLRETPPPADRALFYGDETALGLARALADHLPRGVLLDGVIELAEQDVDAADALGLDIGEARTEPGALALAHAREVPLDGDVRVWLSGRAETVKALHTLFRERGLGRDQLVAKPYWSEQGTAERKAIAAAVA
ncbi:MAG: siderophore-interacting protein [Deltaproteobacteria bacterium]|nr:MAG: siderophore-interacting protein [Deltaproteobacteria bacterium]